MFIVLVFGYNQKMIFSIDCLTASLMDYIWRNSIDTINVYLSEKKLFFTNEI
jgi:hypothetical protein